MFLGPTNRTSATARKCARRRECPQGLAGHQSSMALRLPRASSGSPTSASVIQGLRLHQQTYGRAQAMREVQKSPSISGSPWQAKHQIEYRREDQQRDEEGNDCIHGGLTLPRQKVPTASGRSRKAPTGQRRCHAPELRPAPCGIQSEFGRTVNCWRSASAVGRCSPAR